MHQSAWRSMRILKQWSVPGIVCTIPGANFNTVAKFVASLERHAMVEKIAGHVRGRVGEHQLYRLYPKIANDPTYPQVCGLCDQIISAKVCDPAVKERNKEEERQRGKETKTEARMAAAAASFAGPEISMSEIEAAEQDFYQTGKRAPLPPFNADDYPSTGWHVVPEQLKRRLGGANDAT